MNGEPIQLVPQRGECEVVGEGAIWVPEGLYELAFVGWHTSRMFNRDKLIIEFRVVTPGKAFEACLRRYYNVEIIKPSGKYGRFKASRSTDFVREHAALFGLPRRLDRISMSRYEPVIIQGRVRTVTKARGRRLPEAMRYSIVAELLRVEVGGGK